MLGLMGAGKTTVGKVVAERLGIPLIDGDERLSDDTGGRTAAEIADEQGLDVLHAMEADIALTALSEAQPAVVAPASSVCESTAVRDALAAHLVVWLQAPADLLAERAVRQSHRPLLDHGDVVKMFEEQLATREPLVVPLAGLVVDVSTAGIEKAADAVVTFVGDDLPVEEAVD